MNKFNIFIVFLMTVFVDQYGFANGATTNTMVSQKDLQTFRKEALECHNMKREIHGVHPLTLDEKLTKEAQDYAESLALAGGTSLNKNIPYGQIVYSNAKSDANAESACIFIYKQNKDYDYSKNQPDNIKQVGLFTQMISKATCTVGIGMAKSQSGKLFGVFFYYPIGNVKNEYGTNVLPPISKHQKYSSLDSIMRKTVCSVVDRKTYLQQNLECQNTVRAEYNAPPLVYSEELNKYAIEKVQSLIEGSDRKVQNSNYNTLWIINNLPILDGYFYCQHYYNKGKKIPIDDFEEREKQGKLGTNGGGFSQMIWKSTREMGFAMGKTKNGSVYSLAVYRPKGNTRGAFKQNLSKPKSV